MGIDPGEGQRRMTQRKLTIPQLVMVNQYEPKMLQQPVKITSLSEYNPAKNISLFAKENAA